MEKGDNPRQPALSGRGRDVLQRLGEQQNKQIADELGLSAYGVRFHIRNLFARLGVRSRAEAVRRASEPGLVSSDF